MCWLLVVCLPYFCFVVSLFFLLVSMMFVFFNAQATTTSLASFLFCRMVWMFILHSYLFVVFDYLYFGSCYCFFVFACMWLHRKQLYVVCHFAVICVMCCFSVEQLLFVVVFFLPNMMFVVKICRLYSSRSYHSYFCCIVYPFCSVAWIFMLYSCSSFLVVCILGLVLFFFVFVCIFLHISLCCLFSFCAVCLSGVVFLLNNCCLSLFSFW